MQGCLESDDITIDMSSRERRVQSPHPTIAAANQQSHRRPPDVEEALSSMLWTPYERTPTDTSSEEDDDERLNRRLCRSHTFCAPSTATVATPIGSSSYFGDDLEGGGGQPATSFVPFPTPASPFDCIDSAAYSTVAAITSSGTMATNHHHHQHKNYDSSVGNYRFSYPYYSPLPSLNKWWSVTTASSADETRTSAQTTAECRDANNSSGQATEGTLSREPPSYESLYAKSTTGQRAANALRPVLNTLKATMAGARHKQQQRPEDQQHIEATANQEVIIRTTNDRLVHSFTDDFIAEIHPQHVAATNVRCDAETLSSNDLRDLESDDIPTNARPQQNEETHSNNNNCTLTMAARMHSNGKEMQNAEQVSQLTALNSRTTARESEPAEELSRDNTESNTVKRERRRQTVQPDQARSPASSFQVSFVSCGGVVSRSSSRNSRHSNEIVVGQQLEPETPNNKCLAELERLYEEFRLSESLRESQRNSTNYGNNHNSSNGVVEFTDNMRLNVPAAASVAVAVGTAAAPDSNAPKSCATTTSSVFLTTTNSVTTNCNVSKTGPTNNPCQRQPSLTIQVNNNNNNNSDINSKKTGETQVDLLLHQSIVNNNGVSVVNCNYAPSVNSVSVNSSSRSGFSSVPNCFSVSDKSLSSSDRKNDVNCNEVVGPSAVVPRRHQTTQASDNESVSVISIKPPQSAKEPKTTTTNNPNTPTRSPPTSPTRTYTSTECQTDDLPAVEMRSPRRHDPPSTQAAASAAATSREQRRRERRERRHQVASGAPLATHSNHRRHNDRHSMPAAMLAPPTLHPHHQHHPQLQPPSNLQHLHAHAPPPPPPHHHHMHHVMAPNATMPAAMSAMLRPMLPDILNSHFPPPYSALPPTGPPGPTAGGGGGPVLGPPPPPAPQVGHPPQTVLPGATLLTPVISTLPIPGATPMMGDGRFTLPLPIMRRSPSERSGKGCCGQWFAGPPLRALIAVVALGGVACALGGAALGATGLAGTPSSHLTAALLMIGVGVVLVTVSGAAWRMTAPGGPPCLGLGSSVDLGRCGRRPCSRGGGAPHGLLYPEFQHRPPPPSYQASMQEYRLRLLLLDRDRQNGVIRGNSPPPTYRSHAGSLLRAPLTTTSRGGGGASSSLGGSEYSLPPSYRSRHTGTPGTVSSERSIETAPSGRLLANEDIPEPLSAEHLPDYSSIQLHRCATPVIAAATTTTQTPPTNAHQPSTTAAIIEVETTQRICNANKEKLNPRVFGMKENFSDPVTQEGMMGGGKDLVTIVTISQGDSQIANETQRKPEAAGEQIEILAHL